MKECLESRELENVIMKVDSVAISETLRIGLEMVSINMPRGVPQCRLNGKMFNVYEVNWPELSGGTAVSIESSSTNGAPTAASSTPL